MSRLLLLFVAINLRAQSDPAILQLRVLQGEGTVYGVNSRATRGIVVQVTDETGKPVEGAVVSFRLPTQGPTGEFSAGGSTEIVNTSADGSAEVWGMLWGRETGAFEMRITAAKGATRGSVVCGLYLSAALVTVNTAPAPARASGRKRTWIALGLAAATGVAVVGITSRAPSTGTAAIVNAPKIGTPTILIGRP
ncbi:MAG: hypothetical protein ABI811_17110 [Acidobacteriota bacterium]